MSEVLCLDPRHPEESQVTRICNVLDTGGLVIAPTDTRYGMLVRADLQEHVDHLLAVKRRDGRQPLSVMVKGRSEFARFSRETAVSRTLADRFLPGALTLVLAATTDWGPPRVVNGRIGLRWISLPLIQAVLDHTGFPLSATSANRSGGADFDCVAEIRNEFGHEVDLYIDVGPLTGPASTVIDCTGEIPKVLREGVLAAADIEAACKDC